MEWDILYYSRQDGSKPVEKYLKELPINERAKALAFIELLEKKDQIYIAPMQTFWKMGYMN